jgi:hypothetical protein
MRCASLALAVLLVLLVGPAYVRSARLAFNSDTQTFKIVVFNDMHFGESNDKDRQSLALQKTVLDAERPDMVVFDGDIVSGWMGKKKRGWMEAKMREILEYPNSQGYPHALALGNHDDEANLNRVQVLEEDKNISGELSLTQVGPDDITGASNYYVNVYSGVSGQEDRVDARLWFFDSMNRECEGVQSWGCVGRDTVAWFSELAGQEGVLGPAGHLLQQVAFVHIPLPEHMFGYGDPRGFGIRQADSACPVVNTGLARELALNGVNMVVSGHDHDNEFVGNINLSTRDGVGLGANETGYFRPGSGSSEYLDIPMLMAYGRKSGFGSYGPGGVVAPLAQGARVIELQTFDSAEAEMAQTTEFTSQLNALQYWYLPPQMMHAGPFKWMSTHVRNVAGEREANTRPVFKFDVQQKCYNAGVTVKAFWGLLMSVVVSFWAL